MTTDTSPTKAHRKSAQWCWASRSRRSSPDFKTAGNGFVVARGTTEMWRRVRAEVHPNEECAWMTFGPKDGEATLADCLWAFLQAREQYGVNLNRLMLELARVPVWAKFIHDTEKHADFCNFVSNPVSDDPLPREPYNRDVEESLRRRVNETRGLPDDDE
jgi:hypothetical protein